MMIFVLNLMNLVLEMMNFVVKMMIFVLNCKEIADLGGKNKKQKKDVPTKRLDPMHKDVPTKRLDPMHTPVPHARDGTRNTLGGATPTTVLESALKQVTFTAILPGINSVVEESTKQVSLVKMMNFVVKTRNFVVKTRNFVVKTRNFVPKARERVLKNKELCNENDEFCSLKRSGQIALRSVFNGRILISDSEILIC